MHAATQTAAHWLDIMPAIPLAAAVPLRGVHVLRGMTCSSVCMYYNEHSRRGMINGGPSQDMDLYYRVDLEDPQGYAYALRVLMTHTRKVSFGESFVRSLTRRWLENRTTDADRLALAQALASVSS
jgi:hypothetical protein